MAPRQSLLTEILAPEERAIEAVVGRYQRVAGAVTRVARTLTGREDLRVVLGSSSQSSEMEVVIDPGLFQAAYGRRAPVTPEETALASALHEVVHLVSSDFDERRTIPREWFPEEADEPDDGETPLLEALDRAGGPPAEALFFAIEDARQEWRGLLAYPGARSVLEDLYRTSLTAAFRRSGPLARFSIACFLTVGGYSDSAALERRLDPRSGAAWRDALGILEAVARVDDPWEVADLAMRLLAVARMHGLVSAASEEEQPSTRDLREAEKDAITEGLDRVRLFSPIVQDAEHYQNTRSPDRHETDPSGRPAQLDRASGEGTDQLLRVSQAPVIYLPDGQSGKLTVAGCLNRSAVSPPRVGAP